MVSTAEEADVCEEMEGVGMLLSNHHAEEADVMADTCEEMEGVGMLLSNHHAEEADVMAGTCEEMEGVGMLLSNHHVEGTITSPQVEEAHSIW